MLWAFDVLLRHGSPRLVGGPMTADRRAALVEKMCVAVATAWDNEQRMQDGMSAALDLAIDLIRADVLEEAARVADALEDSLATEWREGRKCDSHLEGKSDGAGKVAAAIRALKGGT